MKRSLCVSVFPCVSQEAADIDTIIDGHNVIFQCGLEGRTRNAGTIGRARDGLVRLLVARMTERQRSRTTIVFDAKSLPPGVADAVSEVQGLTVIYAVGYDEADSLIEELIKKNSNPKQLTVVSSDHRLHRAARRRKATPIDSDAWYDRVDSSQDGAELEGSENKSGGTRRGGRLGRGRDPEESKPDSDGEIPEGLAGIDWAKEFGLDDE